MRHLIAVSFLIAGADVAAQSEVDALRAGAAELCQKHFDGDAVSGPIEPPALVLKAPAKEKTWTFETTLGAAPGASPKSVLCVRHQTQKYGTYDDGSTGYEVLWTVTALSFPEGKVLRRGNLSGVPDMLVKVERDGYGGTRPRDRYGVIRNEELEKWLKVAGGDAVLGDFESQAVLSPDGGTLAVAVGAGSKRKTEILDWPSRTKRRELDKQTPLAFFADGRLITVDKDGLAYWNVGSGQRTGGLKGTYSLAGVPPYSGFSVDGNRLFVRDTYSSSGWDLAAGRAIPLAERDVVLFGVGSSLSADGSVACGVAGNKLALWDVPGNRALAVFDTLPAVAHRVGLCAISADARWAVAQFGEITRSRGLHKIDVAARSSKAVDLFGLWDCLAVSGDGRWLVAGRSGAIAFWDLQTGKEVGTQPGPKFDACGLQFSRDGAVLIHQGSVRFDPRTRFWDSARLLASGSR